MVGTKVYIGGLPYGVRERDLEKFVKGYGRVRDVLLKNGFGFVVSIFLEMIFLHVLSPKSSHPFPVSLLGILLSKLSSFFPAYLRFKEILISLILMPEHLKGL